MCVLINAAITLPDVWSLAQIEVQYSQKLLRYANAGNEWDSAK